jgi:amidase
MGIAEYGELDALGMADLVRRREVSAEELLAEALARVARVNPQINAVVHMFPERARAAIAGGLPDGPFSGVPFLLKDLLAALAGEPMRGGSRLFADVVPTRDSELVRRFKQAGLVIFGKTATPELGTSALTESALTGITRNPWNLNHTSGGSSGGTSAAVAARNSPRSVLPEISTLETLSALTCRTNSS